MILRSPSARRRSGATAVEAGIVLSVFLLFLFGIFEYCRYLMTVEITTNAARDGARYAAVNVAKPSNFDTVDYTDGATTYRHIKAHVNLQMAGIQGAIDDYTVAVFACDSDKLALAVPRVEPKSPAVAWNSAQFGERIAVKITGKYKTILPQFLMMGAEIDINVAVTMSSEG